ncbi:hypothetical protein BD779DRAFT_1669895 [Infundibulicybe gibba]|nr:hypothetical protein BD779DRAFT_1672832 [Infundibulicybe gibba]KAF8893636.1 hypothetical protein BD779DRAFT_1669895 [Infundibulicybe gibba]
MPPPQHPPTYKGTTLTAATICRCPPPSFIRERAGDGTIFVFFPLGTTSSTPDTLATSFAVLIDTCNNVARQGITRPRDDYTHDQTSPPPLIKPTSAEMHVPVVSTSWMQGPTTVDLNDRSRARSGKRSIVLPGPYTSPFSPNFVPLPADAWPTNRHASINMHSMWPDDKYQSPIRYIHQTASKRVTEHFAPFADVARPGGQVLDKFPDRINFNISHPGRSSDQFPPWLEDFRTSLQIASADPSSLLFFTDGFVQEPMNLQSGAVFDAYYLGNKILSFKQAPADLSPTIRR